MRTKITMDQRVVQPAKRPEFRKVTSQLAGRGSPMLAGTTQEGGLLAFKVSSDAPVIPGERAKELLDH